LPERLEIEMKTAPRVPLAAMMFLEYAVWGAWTPILGATLASRLHASGFEIGLVYLMLWAACILTPFIGGQLVDRYMPSQIFLGIAHLIGAVAAWMMAYQTDINGLALWMGVWSLAFAPTLGITNSIAFHHLNRPGSTEKQRERDFSVVRTAGTLGWIVAGLILSWYLHELRGKGVAPHVVPFEEMQFAAFFGVILGLYSFMLPHTPPVKEGTDPWAFTKAFRLFSLVPGFAVFMLISFIVSTEFQFFYVLSGPYLESPQIGIPHEWLSAVKGISQWAELIGLGLLLPIALPRLGMRKTLVLGTLAWPLRYFIFSLGKPLWLVIFSLSFHGAGFAFVFVTSYIYVDRVAPKDIRASAQSLLTLMTLGLGNLLGTLFCGWLKDNYTTFITDPANPAHRIPGPVNWAAVFTWPGLLTLLCALAFWLTFKEPASEEEGSPTQPASDLPPITAEEAQ
jgi:nucleoside transporter